MTETAAIQGFRLSPQQRRLWGLGHGATPAWSLLSLVIEGLDDPEPLAVAARAACARHEVLRTSFRRLPGMTEALQVVEDGGRVQVVERPLRPQEDERAWSDCLRAGLATLEAGLDDGPRLFLFWGRRPAGGLCGALVAPSLCLDEPSLDALAREVVLGDLPDESEVLQFADLAAHLCQLEESAEAAEGRLFWQGRTQPVAPARPLPGQRPAPAGPQAAWRARQVTAPVRAALGRLASTWEVPEEAVWLAAWLGLCAQLSGCSPSVWVRTSGRSYEGLERSLGPFSRTLPLTAAAGEGVRWRELARELATQSAELVEWQDFWLAPPALRPALTFTAAAQLPDLGPGARVIDRYVEIEPAPLGLYARPAGEGLRLELRYDGASLPAAEAETWLARLDRLLADLAVRGDGRLGDGLWLSDAEREPLSTPAPEVPPRTLPEQLAERAARHPERPAVRCRNQALSYGELWRQARGLAAHLRQGGVGPETRVAVCLERSLELLPVLLGVLEAGASFVPLDPAWPAERLALVLGESGARWLVTQQRLLERLPAEGLERLAIDAQPALWREAALAELPPPAPASLAYVLYTSGSTGRPKGVMVHHGALAHYLGWCLAAYGLDRGEETARVPVHSSIGFDLTLTSLLAPLAAGAEVVLLDEQQGLEAILEPEEPFALVKITPAHLDLVAHMLPPEGAASWARTLVVGGEALFGESLDFWRRHAPELTIWNEYGPTETTVGCAVHRLRAGAVEPGPVPIGRPIAGTTLAVVNGLGQPVAAEVAGELWIGGPGVGRGYFASPGQTAERFRPDPWATVPGARAYASGDRVERLPGGALRFLGRLDGQVKIRGFRLELGEVEAALLAQPAVREAVVLVRTDPAGKPRLAAYVVPSEGAVLDPEALRAALGQILLDAMVPSAIVELATLPLTRNGKVDRGALPEPSWAGKAAEGPYLAPRNAVETVLAEVWAGLLGRERVGVDEDFFALGGDSILAIQAVARASRRGVKLVPAQIFEHHTIARLAEVTGRTETVGAEQGPVSGEIPLLPAQAWLLEQWPEGPGHFNQALLLAAAGEVDEPALARALAALVGHHDALRGHLVRTPAGWRQRLAGVEQAAALELLDLSAVPEAELAARQLAELGRLQAGFDLERGPLFRAVLVRRGEGRGDRLFLLAHHTLVDGVSWRVLLDDLAAAYQQARRGEEPALPLKTTSVAFWAQALAERAGAEAASGAAWWLDPERFSAPALPLEGSLEANLEARVEVVEATLERPATEALLRRAASSGLGLQPFLLAALGLALEGWTGADRFLIELEGHGREPWRGDVDLSRTVGWLTSFTPLRLDLRGDGGLDGLAGRIATELAATPDRGLSWGLLRYLGSDLERRERLAALPRPALSFNYLGQLDTALEARGWLQPCGEPVGPAYGPGLRRAHLLEVNALIEEGRLRCFWRFGRDTHHRATVESLARAFEAAFETMAPAAVEPGPRPGDDDFGWNAVELDRISKAIRNSLE